LKKSFTLIEVLIATMVVFIAVGAILGVSSNVKYMINTIISSNNFNLRSSIALIEQKDVKNLYEQIVDFNISDDDIIKSLKQEKIVLEKTEENEDNLTITKLKAYNKNFSNIVFEIGIQ
jgi:Tfp pilus assembly protein PilE